VNSTEVTKLVIEAKINNVEGLPWCMSSSMEAQSGMSNMGHRSISFLRCRLHLRRVSRHFGLCDDCLACVMRRSVKINIQIRTIEAVAAVGTGYLAVLFHHLMTATIADVHTLFSRLILVHWTGFSSDLSNSEILSMPSLFTSLMTASASLRNSPTLIPRQIVGQSFSHFGSAHRL